MTTTEFRRQIMLEVMNALDVDAPVGTMSWLARFRVLLDDFATIPGQSKRDRLVALAAAMLHVVELEDEERRAAAQAVADDMACDEAQVKLLREECARRAAAKGGPS